MATVKMCEDFALNFGDKELAVTTRQRTVLRFLFHQGIFDRKQQDYFSLFPRLKIKLKGHHFDTVEVIEAESQAILNAVTEYDFQDVYKKNDRRAGNCAYARKKTSLRVR
jgi:hypothetical protein